MKASETKLEKVDKQREELYYSGVSHLNGIKKLQEENCELRSQIKDVSWKPSQLQIDIEKIRNPPLGHVLQNNYSHYHHIGGLGLPQEQ